MADPECNQQNNGLFGNQNNRNERDQGRDQQTIKYYFIPGQNMTYGGFGEPPLQATHYEIKPGLLNLLPNFYERENEDPYSHLTEFLDISSTVRFTHFTDDALRLKLFPFSLKDRAKQWINTLAPGSILTWNQCQQEFLKKYFPIVKTNQIRRA